LGDARNGGDKLEFDADALRERYRQERAKRLRADGLAQYRRPAQELTEYLDDPYVAPGFARAPLSEQLDVAVIGGGFGGLLAGARLREAGVENFRIIDKAGDFGGTWYWNRYPGAACDVESYIYMPLLEELGYIPTEKYAKAPEIRAHSAAIGRHFNLYEKALFQTQVTGMRWDDGRLCWIIATDRGDELAARFVCLSTGPLSVPKLPGLPGIETFKGHAFHTSRWDYGYTGGDGYGNLTGLADKRVGIIGTGATAVQAVPHLGAWAKQLYVFQRTPASVDVRGNRPTDPQWAQALQPGWQKRRMENFNNLIVGLPEEEDMVGDGWTANMRTLGPAVPQARRAMADFLKMEQIRARVDATVRDPATAAALKPYYSQMCKRPCFHDEYLDTFNRPNVTLVDTDGRGVERVTETAVVAGGKAYEVDCLIYATGFEWLTNFAARNGFDVVGRGGVLQAEAWKEGVSSLYGLHSRGFPNFFVMCSSQQAFTANFTHMSNEVSRHIAHLVKRCLDEGVGALEPTVEAEQGWVENCLSLANARRAFHMECTPGYYNDEGAPSTRMARNGFWGGSSVKFLELLADWRADEAMPGLEVRKVPTARLTEA
jgi:cation diffusion facilitator CzcD-associated flavoprotein CzcO